MQWGTHKVEPARVWLGVPGGVESSWFGVARQGQVSWSRAGTAAWDGARHGEATLEKQGTVWVGTDWRCRLGPVWQSAVWRREAKLVKPGQVWLL